MYTTVKVYMMISDKCQELTVKQLPLVQFLSIKKSAMDIDKLMCYYQEYMTWVFGIPAELLPLPSEALNESMSNT